MEMNYRVVWPKETLDELAAAWLSAADRNAVTAASNQLDQDLAHDPYAVGIPIISSQKRSASEPPIAVVFEIVEDDKKVRVLRVWSMM